MVISYIKIALRNLIKFKGFTLINVFGLALGMAVCVLVSLYIRYELSFDSDFPDNDRIYRIIYQKSDDRNVIRLATSPVPLAEVLNDRISDLQVATRLVRGGSVLVKSRLRIGNENQFFFADQNFFKVFAIDAIAGETKTALAGPGRVVLTQSAASRYFGRQNPIGQRIQVENETEYTVTAVIPDFPDNTHFHFDILRSFSTLPASKSRSWLIKNVYTYLKVFDDKQIETIQSAIDEITRQNDENGKTKEKSLLPDNHGANRYAYRLQQIKRIHLWSHLEYELEYNGNVQNLYIFSLTGIAILLVACFNFMNLATARYMNRFREVGLRKVLGANRGQLLVQFLIETLFLTVSALIIALSMVELFLPVLNFFAGTEIRFSLIRNPWLIPFALLLAITVGIVAGSYPAVFLSAFKPINIIRGDFNTAPKHLAVRKVLVIIQFTAALLLIMMTFYIYHQLAFLTRGGFSSRNEQVIILPRAYLLDKKLNDFKSDLLTGPGIINVSATRDIPGAELSIIGFQIDGHLDKALAGMYVFGADRDFIRTFSLKLKQGYAFDSVTADQQDIPVLINQKAETEFNLDRPIGVKLTYFDPKRKKNIHYHVVGVVEDFYFESMKQPIKPLVIIPTDETQFRYICLRIKSDTIRSAIDHVELVWGHYIPQRPLEYFYLDDDLMLQYNSEQRIGQVFIIFSFFSVLIASMGMLGLVAFNIERRTREIGLRKAMGATSPSIIVELSRDILLMIGMASIVSWPLSYLALRNWLNRFAYHVPISIAWFLLPTAILLAITALTIGTQVTKAAFKNPVDLIYKK